VDGRDVGKSPSQVELPVGRHLVEADFGSLYHKATQTVVLTPAGARIELSPRPAFGELLVTSVPSGAQVLLNGDVKGLTPLTLAQCPSGKHEVRVSLTGFDPAIATVEVRDGRTTSHRADLSSNLSAVVVETDPAGASVWLDGQDTGMKTPCTLSGVQAGERRLTLKIAGHDEESLSLAVQAGKPARLSRKLNPLMGLLVVHVADARGVALECAVTVDGKLVGVSPWKGTLLASRHRVEAECSEGAAFGEVEIQVNRRSEVRLVVASNGAVPLSEGTIRPPEKTVRPWYRKWWVWTLVGGVAAAGVGTALGLTLGDRGDGGPRSGGVLVWR
jgi:hypothetical protein